MICATNIREAWRWRFGSFAVLEGTKEIDGRPQPNDSTSMARVAKGYFQYLVSHFFVLNYRLKLIYASSELYLGILSCQEEVCIFLSH